MGKDVSFFVFLKQTITEHYRSGYLFVLFGFLSLTIFLNYYFRIEKSFMYPISSNPSGIFAYILFYGFAYFLMLIVVLNNKNALWKSNRIWILSFGVIASLSVSATYFYLTPFIQSIETPEHRYIARKILVNSRNMLFVAVPALIFWKYIKDKNDSFFWLSFKKIKLVNYLLFLLPVIFLAYLASLTDSFLITYPTFKTHFASNMLEINKFFWAVIYEFIYAIDFVWIEFLFRGILVIGLFRVLGKDAIIPMVSMYCFLHFGKPLGEAISSVFGGYFLGLLAIYSRSIVGGCFLHIGVALSMDFFANLRI